MVSIRATYVQCDRVGRFLELSTTTFITKATKIFGFFLGYHEKHRFSVKTALDTFRAAFMPTSGHPVWRTFENILCQHLVTLITFKAKNSFLKMVSDL